MFKEPDGSFFRYAECSLDKFAGKVTELAGDDLEKDAALDSIVTLKRAGEISGADAARYSITHLREKKLSNC